LNFTQIVRNEWRHENILLLARIQSDTPRCKFA
jgi:hypothetical protein